MILDKIKYLHLIYLFIHCYAQNKLHGVWQRHILSSIIVGSLIYPIMITSCSDITVTIALTYVVIWEYLWIYVPLFLSCVFHNIFTEY